MNQRDSSGLPLRAMVMVLLFLGVVFLLVGFQAMGSGDDSDDADAPQTSVVTTTASPTSSKAAARAEVRVFNISDVAGAAEGTANRLREQGWNVTQTGNLTLEGVTATTVYFSNAPGEQQSADEVAKVLQAPVAPRPPALTSEPPGVIVAVTG
jgi:hypothetical protein